MKDIMTSNDSKKILLVEDNATLNDAFSLLLEKKGYQVQKARDGKEALDMVGDFKPDIILLDLLMPVMDGKEFLRNFDNRDEIPVVVLSNLDAKAEVQEAMKLGASHYMLKAWATPKELTRVIEDTIGAKTKVSR